METYKIIDSKQIEDIVKRVGNKLNNKVENNKSEIESVSKNVEILTSQLKENTNEIFNANDNINNLSSTKAEKSELQSETNSRKQEIALERARIDNLTTLREGSTTGDAELTDARIDKYGITHKNVGEHIRHLAEETTKDIDNKLNDGIESLLDGILWSRQTVAGGKIWNNANNWLSSTVIALNKDSYLNVYVPSGLNLRVIGYTSEEDETAIIDNSKQTGVIFLLSKYVYRFLITKKDGTQVTEEERDTVTITKKVELNKVIDIDNTKVLSSKIEKVILNNIMIPNNFDRGCLTGNGTLSESISSLVTNKKYFLEKGKEIFFNIKEGYAMSIWLYKDEQTTAFFSETVTQTKQFIVPKNAYCNFVSYKIDGSSIYKEDLNDTHCYWYLNEKTNNDGSKLININWKRGTMAGTGTVYNSDTNWISNIPLQVATEKRVNFMAPEGYKLTFWRFKTIGENAEIASSITSGTYVLVPNKFYFIVLSKIDNSIITEAELQSCGLSYYPEASWKTDVIKNAGTYATEYHSEEDNVINKVYNSATDNCIRFGLITDSHCGQDDNIYPNLYNHASILDKITTKALGDFTINLGDTFHHCEDHTENKRRLMTYWKNHAFSTIPNLYCQGNHESFMLNDGSKALENSQILAVTNNSYKWIQKSNINKLYYYFDIRNVRCIVLASSTNTNSGFSVEQLDFLRAAFETIGDKKAVIFSHIPSNGSVCNISNPKNGNEITRILEENSEKIIAYFHGHAHWDNVVKINGITYISTACAIPNKCGIPSDGYGNSATAPDRLYGTYSEFLFDIVTIDVEEKEVKMFRFGAGEDRIIDCN